MFMCMHMVIVCKCNACMGRVLHLCLFMYICVFVIVCMYNFFSSCIFVVYSHLNADTNKLSLLPFSFPPFVESFQKACFLHSIIYSYHPYIYACKHFDYFSLLAIDLFVLLCFIIAKNCRASHLRWRAFGKKLPALLFCMLINQYP